MTKVTSVLDNLYKRNNTTKPLLTNSGYCGVEKRYLATLIMWKSYVRVIPPQPKINNKGMKLNETY
jgi:hypothetical protein